MKSNENPTQESHANQDAPLTPIREHRDAVEELADDCDRDDGLDAAARILLAIADGERPDDTDLEVWGLGYRERYGNIHYCPPSGNVRRLSSDTLRWLSRRILTDLSHSTVEVTNS